MGVIIAFAVSSCSGTPEAVMVQGSILFPAGSHSVADTSTCLPAASLNELTIRTSGVNPFGSPPGDSVIGKLAEGVVTGDQCRVSFEAGPIERHSSLSIYIGECGRPTAVFVPEDHPALEERDSHNLRIYSRSKPDGDGLAVLNVDTIAGDLCP